MRLWANTKLTQLPYSIWRDIYFYAPLLDSLEFMGTEPVTYVRAGTTSVDHRGKTRTIAANVPPFEYDGETPLGLFIGATATLTFSTQNTLDDADTLIWFENNVPKSTPANTNPIDAGGVWTGNTDVHIKHLVKALRTLSNAEIAMIQNVLASVVQAIPDPPAPPINPAGSFVTEVPAHVGGAVYELSQDPNLNSLLVAAHGGLFLKRVASGPGSLEFTAGGTGNRTLTLGLAPSPVSNIVSQYVVA